MLELGLRVRKLPEGPHAAVLTPVGPLDARNVAALERALASSHSRSLRSFVLDLESVRYINSAGMSCLVRLGDALAARGGTLALANAQPKVKVVLDLMGLTSLLPLYPSVEAALRKLGR